ncbi:MAG: OmpA family protein [Acidobacteriota bacterium]
MQPDGNQPIAVFKVEVVSRTMKAINYHHRQGSTKVDFRGTQLAPEARGEATVDSRTGATKVSARFSHLEPAARFGPEFVTYVLWAITPEGRTDNLGEVFLDGSNSSIQTSTDLQAFGLMVTAEPYFAVSQPSDVVVLENFIRKDTTGTIEEVDAKVQLLQRGIYTRHMDAAVLSRMKPDKSVPLDLQEARNAIAIARNAGAEKYAADTLQKAVTELQNAEGFFRGKGDKKMLQTVARQSTQMSEDARIISLKKMDEEARAAAAEREVQARKEAENQTRQRAAADLERERADAARVQAEAASRQAEKDRAAAEAARMAALEQQKRLEVETASARAATEQANALRAQAEKDRAALREQLRNQLNLVLETRDTARGLIVNMSDVLFDTGKYTLRGGTKEKLAKVSGILLAHPGLRLEIEGHTDSVGAEDYNQTLSEHRAEAVRDYLVGQGISPDSVSAKGFGETKPVASNDTAEGRQRNRRVELVVSGEAITGSLPPDSAAHQ